MIIDDDGMGGRGRAAGFSLVEIMFVLVILGVVLISIAFVSEANARAYGTGAVRAHLEDQAVATVERLAVELSIAGRDTLAPDPAAPVGADSINYLQATGMNGNEVVWSELRRLSFEYEIGELDDGLDNNGNGLVDEGCVVLTEDVGGPNERRHVLTHWVSEYGNGLDDNANGLSDEHGFVVERVGETLILRLTLQRPDAGPRLLTRTVRTSTRMRN